MLLIRTACKDPTVMDNTVHILHNCTKADNRMANGMRLYRRSVDEHGKLYWNACDWSTIRCNDTVSQNTLIIPPSIRVLP